MSLKEIDKKIIESDLERIRLTNTSIYIYSKKIDNTQIDKKLLEWKVEKLKAILDEYAFSEDLPQEENRRAQRS